MTTRHFPLAAALGAMLALPPAAAPAAAAPAKHHMIVAAEPDAAEAGLEMLRAGGSAVDALIAAQMVLGLEEPQSSGMGGGSYIVVSDGDKVHAYDGREMAPASAKPGMFLNDQGQPNKHDEMIPGGLSVGIPGTVAVLAMAHKAHGRLPWARLFQPAIKLAENGFKVPPRLAGELADGGATLASRPDIRAAYFTADGMPVKAGAIWRNPKLAASLRRVAEGGPNAYYKGAIATDIAAAVSKAPLHPTMMTTADLASYQAKERPALCGLYRSYRICSLPPSTSGGASLLEILGLLTRFPPANLQPDTLSAVHLISEASRLSYADRNRWLGDTDFVAVPLQGLLDAAYLDARSQLIDPMHAMGVAMAGMPLMQKGELLNYAPQRAQIEEGTSHIVAIDDRGEAVSMTTSVESAFGAQIMADGFILNNELTDFSFEPVIDGQPVANAPAAGKRPLSSMTPVIVFGPDGKFFAALGSPGGRQIIAFVAQAIIGLIDGHQTMAEAAAAPRHINLNGPTFIEKGTALESLTPALTAMGHTVRSIPFFSGINGIRRVAGGYEGAADPRREGVALGD